METIGSFHVIVDALMTMLVGFTWQATLIGIVHELIARTATMLSAQRRYLFAMLSLAAMAVGALGTFITFLLSRTATVATGAQGVSFGYHIGQAQLNASTVVALWLAGTTVLTARNVQELCAVRRLARDALLPPAWLDARFQALAHAMHAGGVALRLHLNIDGPLMVGVIRKVVYLPLSALTSLTSEQLEMVLAHEVGHVLRADFCWNLLQRLLETLFFFHPMVWRVSGIAREQRELCCDIIAVRGCADPVLYASALLALEEQRRLRPSVAPALACHAMHARSPLLHRIRHILERAPSRGNMNFAPLAMLISVLCLLTGLGLQPTVTAVRIPVQRAEQGQQPETTSPVRAHSAVVVSARRVPSTSERHDDANHRVTSRTARAANPHMQREYPVPPDQLMRDLLQAEANARRRQNPVSPDQLARDSAHIRLTGPGGQPASESSSR